MATRTKTIEFSTTVDIATLTAATNRDKTITIYIPETIVAFRSCVLMCNFRGDNTAAASLGAAVITIGTSGAFTTSSASTAATPAPNSGESEAWCYAWDFAAFFTTNWSGTSATWSVRVNCPGIATANHSFKLLITYEYDDTSATHIKTIRIPIESTRASLTNAFQTLGGATAIPAVEGSYLPEASVVVRQAFLELAGNESGISSTSDYTIQGRINGGASVDLWRSEQALQGMSLWAYSTWDITAEDLSAARSIEVLSTVTGRVEQYGGWLTVTYEFDPASTTTVYNSLIMGALDTTGWGGGTASTDADAWGRDIFIEEPGTITLKESGIFLAFNVIANPTVNVSVGAQTYRAYAYSVTKLITLGQMTLMHRIDAGGQVGTDFVTLTRGRNAYLAKVYSSNADDVWGFNGCLILNYTSGKATAGVGAHAQSRFFLIGGISDDLFTRQVNSKAAAVIPESNYWVVDASLESWITIDNSTNLSIAYQAERGTGEGDEEMGWETLAVTQFRGENENQNLTARFASRKSWRRHPAETDPDRLDLETSRSWRVDAPIQASTWFGMWVTWHTHTWTVSGTITGSGGGTVNLYLFRESDNAYLAATSRTGNGSYSFTWYDDTENLYVRAYESASLIGQSAPDLAS